MDVDDVDTGTLLAGKSDWMDASLAERLSQHPLESIETEFPHHAQRFDSAGDVDRPKERHPVFYGCFDWHSAVHSHWALARQLRLFDDHPREAEIVQRFDDRFIEVNVATEVERFEESPSFEKPYGWAWLLHLAAELARWDDERASEWRATLAPLEEIISGLVEAEFLAQDRPFRVGTHQNSAFALHCVLDYARTTGRDSLATVTAETAKRFFGDDVDYPVEYEPLGWDFLSPTLTEADLMRRVYDHGEFRTWIDEFLPDLQSASYDAIFEPATVDSSPDEGVALHLAGLNLSRAWCMAGIADALDGHRYAEGFEIGARKHAERGLEGAFTDDYAGSHWLSSFALYFLSRNDGGIAPE